MTLFCCCLTRLDARAHIDLVARSEEALADPYFTGLSQPSREPSAQPVSKLAFEFERRKLAVEEVRDLIYREILEYHPQMLADFMAGGQRQANFVYPSAGVCPWQQCVWVRLASYRSLIT